MNMFQLKIYILLGIIFINCHYSNSEEKITVQLKYNYDYVATSWEIVDFRKNKNENFPDVAAKPGEVNIGKALGNILVQATRFSGNENAYLLKIDSDNDGKIEDEAEYKILPDSSFIIQIERKTNRKEIKTLPYLISYSHRIDQNNKINEYIKFINHFRLEGKLSVDSCEIKIALVDSNMDGFCNLKDALKGTNLCIDYDNNGKIYGMNEWRRCSEIIELCGKHFLVDSIDFNESFITFEETNLRSPKIGEKIPAFTLETIDQKIIQSDSLMGSIFILDFWASWCVPCVAKFPILREIIEKDFNDRVKVITINVDEQNRVENAHKIVKEYDLLWPTVISGKGQSDPFWKIFGGIELNRFSIPLYVLIDENGIIQYADYGGNNLSELKEELSKLLNHKMP